MDSHGSNSAPNSFSFTGNFGHTATEQPEEMSSGTSTPNTVSTMESSPSSSYTFTVTTARKLTRMSKASKERLLKKIEQTWKLIEHYIENHVTEESQFREIEKMLDNIRVKLLRMKTARNRVPNIKKDRVVKGRGNRQNRLFAPKKMQKMQISRTRRT